jgi:hypothetical protein
MILVSSCELAPRSQELVISNGSGYPIDTVYIYHTGVGSKGFAGVNALVDGETIAAGGEKSFYLAPYTEYTRLEILNTNSGDDVIEFTFTYKKGAENEKIRAVFDGTDITVSGSNASILLDD